MKTHEPDKFVDAPIIFLMGPTAIGKTELAMELVQRFPFEIISVDSAMIYRGMDIGTGKPQDTELQTTPHHLVNIRNPDEAYSAAAFSEDALQSIQEIKQKNKIPLLVGGTMLYFRALEEGLSPLPKADPVVRAQLLKEAEECGWESLHQRLKKVDPDSAAKIHPNDPQRIQRALEVYEITQKPLSECWQIKDPAHAFQIKKMALIPKERKTLHAKIEKRFDSMLEQGFIEEVKTLWERYPNLNSPAMRAVGYRQIWEYLDGKLNYNTMRDKAITATRQLAKRQLTWLRNSDNLRVFEIENNYLDSLSSVLHFVS